MQDQKLLIDTQQNNKKMDTQKMIQDILNKKKNAKKEEPVALEHQTLFQDTKNTHNSFDTTGSHQEHKNNNNIIPNKEIVESKIHKDNKNFQNKSFQNNEGNIFIDNNIIIQKEKIIIPCICST